MMPNPAHDILNFNSAYSYTIFDVNGRKIIESENAVRSADIGQLPVGIYFLEWKENNRIYREKIIKN
jgi:hypothetical protein